MQLLRYILIPIVPIYYLVTWTRNKLYDRGILKSYKFDLPIICVGNLSTGGTGKSPMIEYLIRLLQSQYRIAVLSRGYKRSSDGYVLATDQSRVEELGDEPFQIHRKFPGILVAVDSDRVRGINNLLKMPKPPQLILLDDGFQHRKVKAGLNILLTVYNSLYTDDMVLPTGNLREPISGAQRAQMVVVTKCPETISKNEMNGTKKRLDKGYNQKFYFSAIGYGEQIRNESKSLRLGSMLDKKFTLVTGIANAKPMVDYLKNIGCDFSHMEFNDHHIFTEEELNEISQQDFVLTTEKDYVRLINRIKNDRLYYLPIRHIIKEGEAFNQQILDYCSAYSIGAAEL